MEHMIDKPPAVSKVLRIDGKPPYRALTRNATSARNEKLFI
jgi:hypothetical protein